MAERLNRDPSYDLARHIRTGEKVPLSGDPAIRQYDAELDRNDPMQPTTDGFGDGFVFSPDASSVMQLNDAQATGLSPGNVDHRPAEGMISSSIDMNMANDCLDEPTKGGIAYGPRFTGDNRGGY